MPRRNGQQFTPLEEACIEHFLVLNNQTEAYNRAKGGKPAKYGNKTAAQIFSRPHIRAEVERRRKAMAAELKRTAEDVVRDIQETTKEARQAGNFPAAFKGYELEGKYLGMFVDRMKHEHSFDGVSDEDLLERLAVLLSGGGE